MNRLVLCVLVFDYLQAAKLALIAKQTSRKSNLRKKAQREVVGKGRVKANYAPLLEYC
jgi:hypothetical protein